MVTAANPSAISPTLPQQPSRAMPTLGAADIQSMQLRRCICPDPGLAHLARRHPSTASALLNRDVAAPRLDHAVGADLAANRPRPCSAGTPALPRRRVAQTLAG